MVQTLQSRPRSLSASSQDVETRPGFQQGTSAPTISLNHCFFGSEDAGPDGEAVPALENPFLTVCDADSEAVYCLPFASKAVAEYLVYCVKSVIDEL